jgi:hypothetical protein
MAFAAFGGCIKPGDEGEDELPKPANDPEVVARWDEFEILSGLPRYAYSGVHDDFYTGDDGTVVVSFVGVSAEDFIRYTDELSAAGFALKDNSSIWITENMSGVPIFVKGDREVTLVWNLNLTLDISVSRIG